MVYICLPVAYYHFNLDVTEENLLAAGFSAVPAVFLAMLIVNLKYSLYTLPFGRSCKYVAIMNDDFCFIAL